jgi:seryl-tRNA synthetase
MSADAGVVLEWARLREDLVDAGIVVDLGGPGLYAQGPEFVGVYRAFDALMDRTFADLAAEVWRFPAVEPKSLFERTDYVASFPQLTAALVAFGGGNSEHAELLRVREDGGCWEELFAPAGVLMSPAACHQLYGILAGERLERGRTFDIHGACYRHEPSLDPLRMQAFHQHEYPFVGDAEDALAHRDAVGERMRDLLCDLGLGVVYEVSNDPFFGRAGRMLARNQLSAAAKYEFSCPVFGCDRPPVALGSANYHGTHFATEFSITGPDGGTASSSCVGLGMERVVVSLFALHGMSTSVWPNAVRALLWPSLPA